MFGLSFDRAESPSKRDALSHWPDLTPSKENKLTFDNCWDQITSPKTIVNYQCFYKTTLSTWKTPSIGLSLTFLVSLNHTSHSPPRSVQAGLIWHHDPQWNHCKHQSPDQARHPPDWSDCSNQAPHLVSTETGSEALLGNRWNSLQKPTAEFQRDQHINCNEQIQQQECQTPRILKVTISLVPHSCIWTSQTVYMNNLEARDFTCYCSILPQP